MRFNNGLTGDKAPCFDCKQERSQHEWRCRKCGALSTDTHPCNCGAHAFPTPACGCKIGSSLYCATSVRRFTEHDRLEYAMYDTVTTSAAFAKRWRDDMKWELDEAARLKELP